MKQTVNVVFLGMIVIGLWYTIGYVHGWENATVHVEMQTEDTPIEDE